MIHAFILKTENVFSLIFLPECNRHFKNPCKPINLSHEIIFDYSKKITDWKIFFQPGIDIHTIGRFAFHLTKLHNKKMVHL